LGFESESLWDSDAEVVPDLWGRTTTEGCVQVASGTFNQFSSGIISGSVYYSFLLRVNSTTGLDGTCLVEVKNQFVANSNNGFARLAAGSDLIDAGVDVGLPFSGSAPDR
jgi:hypothetical protein